MFACRNCRISIAAESGCAVCDPFRKHLVALDESEDEKPSLSEVGIGVVADLQYARRASSTIMRNTTLPAKDRLDATARILKIGNTAAKVLEAARKLQTDGITAIQNMSFLERAELFVTWYTALPPPHRVQLRKKMDEFEAATQLALPDAASST